jgi:hypothetical protein
MPCTIISSDTDWLLMYEVPGDFPRTTRKQQVIDLTYAASAAGH